MTMSDPTADMLTRIRNATRNKAKRVEIKKTKVCLGVAEVLKTEGYISDYEVAEDRTGQGTIQIDLKYGPRGEVIINEIKRASKPGRRLYTKVGAIPQPLQGMGISVVSTSHGVFSDRQCREKNVGGELLCTLY
ncbi:MAG: small subunit ribosomal protein S8 [Phycisphaerales bacterium]|jgi:small subunit ribosomal protein S8